MEKKIMFPLLAVAVIVFGVFSMMMRTQPVILDDDAGLPEETEQSAENGIEIIPDMDVPMGEAPADPYEGLSDAQIQFVDKVLALVNEERTKAGVGTLVLDAGLMKAAQIRSAECVGTFSHTRPNGSPYKTAITEAGVTSSYTGENAATGHSSPEQVVSRWMQSEGHKANILNGRFNRIGIGFTPNTGNRYKGYAWVQLFAA